MAKEKKRTGARVELAMTTNWSIDGVKDALRAKKISARELAADFYKRIESRNPQLNAFLTLSPERARRQTDRMGGVGGERKPVPAAGRRARGCQGRHQYARDKDDVWLEGLRELCSAVRCDRG